jgi:hypothetical protein
LASDTALAIAATYAGEFGGAVANFSGRQNRSDDCNRDFPSNIVH